MNDSSYWGPPRHDLPLTHAPPNSTDSYRDPGLGGGQSDWGAPASASAPAYSGGSGYGGGSFASGPARRSKRSIPIAIVLALLLGPFGLFYVNILSGITALIVLPDLSHHLASRAAVAVGGVAPGKVATVLILWCFTVPWTIIGVLIRNARIDRAG